MLTPKILNPLTLAWLAIAAAATTNLLTPHSAFATEPSTRSAAKEIAVCVQQLKETLPSVLIDRLKKASPHSPTSNFDYVLSEIRTKYLREEQSPLAQMFVKHGIHKVETMSTIVLIALYNDLHFQKPDLEKLLKDQARMEVQNKPEVFADHTIAKTGKANEQTAPKEILNCVKKLKASLPSSLINELKAATPDTPVSDFHRSIGIDIRNNYLYGRSDAPLAQLFFKHDIHQPDNMSTIILIALYNDLHSHKTDFEKLFKARARMEMLGRPEVRELITVSPILQSKVMKTGKSDFTLKQLLGKVVIISEFRVERRGWCKEAIEALNKIQKQYSSKDIQIIGFVIDDLELADQDARYKEKFLTDFKPQFPTALTDINEFCSDLIKRTCLYNPQVVIISRSGKIISYFNGWHKDTEQKLNERVAEAIGTSAHQRDSGP